MEDHTDAGSTFVLQQVAQDSLISIVFQFLQVPPGKCFYCVSISAILPGKYLIPDSELSFVWEGQV